MYINQIGLHVKEKLANMVDFEIGNRLKLAREKLNLSQSQLANLLDIHK